MNSDSFSEVTSTSWFSRLGNAFKGILFGLILVAISFPLLFWNEGRAVKRYKTLKEGGGAVIQISSERVDPVNQDKLVHMTGSAATGETLTDPIFTISRPAIKLKRTVEMYQWKEESQSQEKKKLGGGTETTTTYSYSKTWSDRVIHSGEFKKQGGHENPGNMPYHSDEQVAGSVSVGAFTLPRSMVAKINEYTPVIPGSSYTLPDSLADTGKIHSGTIFIGDDPAAPQIGDIRVTFAEVKPLVISLVARQTGSTLKPYHAQAGGTIELLVAGPQSAEEMFQHAQRGNTIITWMIRAGGYIIMTIGVGLILAPLSVFADVVPIFGTIVAAGTGLISSLISGFLTFFTIAVAWIFYRPVLGIVLLMAAGSFAIFLITRLRKTPPADTVDTTPPPPF